MKLEVRGLKICCVYIVVWDLGRGFSRRLFLRCGSERGCFLDFVGIKVDGVKWIDFSGFEEVGFVRFERGFRRSRGWVGEVILGFWFDEFFGWFLEIGDSGRGVGLGVVECWV